ncbi:MAG TPA: TIR domain-containing protein, partial [Waddliaceae bacterium]
KSVSNFLKLVSNENRIIEDLNKESIWVDIKIMFAYPYSDYMYDIIQAEQTNQDGFSMDCVLTGNKIIPDFRITKKITYSDLNRAVTYNHLVRSLEKLQNAVISGKKVFNNKNVKNRVVVKFTPLNILVCLLKINHKLFIDPYMYSKQQVTSFGLKLNAPISAISIPDLPEIGGKQSRNDSKILEHYCSLISHFRYLWQHPFTLYSTDATEYDKWVQRTLSKIKEPGNVSYLGKALRLKAKTAHKQNEIDLWMQYCKNGLLKYCNKFIEEIDSEVIEPESLDINNLKPITIFIIGAWDKDGPREEMKAVRKFFLSHFSADKSDGGLNFSPVLVDGNNGEHLHKILFENLDSSQLGLVVLTSDNATGNPKPNVILERGYLMGRLGRKNSRASKNKNMEAVFVFKHMETKDGTDVQHIISTQFSDLQNLKLQFFKIVKWLWDITELNSEHAREILERQKVLVQEFDSIHGSNHVAYIDQIDQYIEEISVWNKNYLKRMQRLNTET